MAKEIRTGKVTSEELVRHHINLIKEFNPRLNAVVATRFDEAMQEAKAADDYIKKNGTENLPIYHGVPCTTKENFALKGMPNSAGLVSRKNLIAQEDATTVARMKKAGLIIMGVTNLSELGMWMESFNHVYGRTNNAYNKNHISGGSSGGEGSIIGSGASPLGLGADIGGSIRMPAFFNGVFGHKPSGGLVPGSGQYPLPENEALRYIATGPICRKAEDLFPLLKIMAGPDGIDSGTREFTLKDPKNVRIQDLKVYFMESGNSPFTTRVQHEMKDAVLATAARLSEVTAPARRVHIKLLREGLEIWASMLGEQNQTTFKEMLSSGKNYNPYIELFKSLLNMSDHTIPGNVLAIIESLTKLSPEVSVRYAKKGEDLKKYFAEMLKDDGIFIYPSYPTSAPKHNAPLLRPVDWVYTAIFNVLELPVTQVPLGFDRFGLPVGVQIVTGYGQDHNSIAVAQFLEKQFGGWKPPSYAVTSDS